MDPPADAPAPPDPGVVPPGFVQNVEGAFGQLGNTLTTILTLLNTLVLNSSVNVTANASANQCCAFTP
jgi:hypothetical protein